MARQSEGIPCVRADKYSRLGATKELPTETQN